MAADAVVTYPHHMDLSGHRIGGLGDPSSAQEAATKAYVDTGNSTGATLRTYTSNGVTSGASYTFDDTTTLTGSTATTALFIEAYRKLNYAIAADQTLPGHSIVRQSHFTMMATGHTVALAIADQSKLELFDGAMTSGWAHVSTIHDVALGKTLGEFVGNLSQANDNHGTITAGYAFRAALPTNNGTVFAKWVGLHIPAWVPVTRPIGIHIENANACIVSAAGICDDSYASLIPTNGSTITVPRACTLVLVQPAGTIAGCTITFAADIENGQSLEFYFTQTVTTITWTGGTPIGAPTTAIAGASFSIRKIGVLGGLYLRRY